MDRAQIHFELFVRQRHGSGWTLELADRGPRPRRRRRRGGPGREARRRRQGDQGDARGRDPRVQVGGHPVQGRAGAGQGQEAAREPRALVRLAAGPLHRPRARPHWPPARRLAGAQPGHAVRAAAPAGADREAGRFGHGTAARHPEGGHSRGPGARHRRARDHPQLPAPGAGDHRPGAARRAQGRLATCGRGQLRRCRRAAGRRAGAPLPAGRGRRPGHRRGRHLARQGQQASSTWPTPRPTRPRRGPWPSRCWRSPWPRCWARAPA